MSWLGSLVEGAFSLFGGRRADKAQEQANRENTALQREFAQQGIRWKVEDAKAAGLHPLYALGGSGATFQPSVQALTGTSQAMSQMGQSLGRAASAMTTPEEQAERNARLKVLEAQAARDFALASQAASETARMNQEQMPGLPLSDLSGSLSGVPVRRQGQALPPGHIPGQGDSVRSLVKIKPDEVIAGQPGDSSRTAGRHSFWREYQVTDSGLRMMLPYSEEGPGEASENIAWWQWPAVIQYNRNYYGDGWLSRAVGQGLFGLKPKYRQMPSREKDWQYRPERFSGRHD